MSLDKAIQHHKERRRTYRARGLSGEFDRTCRPHGSCDYCARNRTIWRRRLEAIARLRGKEDDAQP